MTVELAAGEIVGVIGPNGAGKTTLLNLLSGVLQPDSGTITVEGKALPPKLHRVARAGISRTFQNIRLFGGLSVKDNVAATSLVPNRQASTSVADLLEAFDLADLHDRRADTLAYGDQRRLEMARSAATGSSFVLLDEPAAGMNEVESVALRETIARLQDLRGAGILIVEHDLAFIFALCQRIYVLDAGRVIACGTPEEVAADPAVVEAYIGTPTTGVPDLESRDRG